MWPHSLALSLGCGGGNRTAKTNNAITTVVLAVVGMAQDVRVVKVVRLKWKLW